MLVALSTKLGAPLAKDVEGLKRNLSSLVGGSSGYSGSSSASSWRSTPAAAAPAGGDRWSKYSAGEGALASAANHLCAAHGGIQCWLVNIG
jgi:hypothetical protein